MQEEQRGDQMTTSNVESFDKQPVQNFQWDGSPPTLKDNTIWLTSIDGSQHGWPQLTEHEAVRLALFLHGATSQRVAELEKEIGAYEAHRGDALAERAVLVGEVKAWRTAHPKINDPDHGGHGRTFGIIGPAMNATNSLKIEGL